MSEKKVLGKKLVEALTIDELIQFLDALLTSIDKEQIEEVLSNLNGDIEKTISQLLYSENSSKVSDNKFLQEWRNLWKDWDNFVWKLGDEKGKYVYQDNDWETPYFASNHFAEDLENIAIKMLPLLDKICEMQVEAAELFEDALREIESGIIQYPEWMGAEYSDCYADVAVTECMVKWAWLNADSVEMFLNSLTETEDNLNIITLHDNGYINCFNEFTEDERKEIYNYITQSQDTPVWEERLENTHSLWHGIYHDFSRIFDQETHLETCRKLLHENWEYGIPLLKDCLKKDNLLEADKIAGQTVNSFLREGGKKLWDPEKSLLISEISCFSHSPNHSILELMKSWIDIADKMNMPSKVSALKFQIATYETPYEWDKVAGVIEKIKDPAVSDLIENWKIFCSAKISKQSDGCWVKWLMDASLDGNKDSAWLFKKIKKWLTALSDDPKALISQQSNFFSLTFEIGKISDLKKQYPSLFETIYEPWKMPLQTPSILKWLKKMNGISVVPLLEKCWIKHVLTFVPNPANVHRANYETHAKWLAALSELNPEVYKTIITQWKKLHKRRKNLWKAIQDIGIDVS